MNLIPKTPFVFALFLFAVAGVCAPAWSAEPAKEKEVDKARLTVTDASKADADFAYQGEFFGRVLGPSGGQELIGLQVVAQGAGKFDVYHLQGGLPGAGWDRRTRTKIDSFLKDGVVTGQNAQYGVTITPDTATIRDSAGKVLGTIERIRRVSPTMGAAPPANAVVLFNGSPPTELEAAKLTRDGLLEIGSTTKAKVQDFQLHVEFRTPYMPYARGQGRGNSGVYIQQRYELQILDSFGLEGIENECGSLYRQQRPEVNMALPPLTWQTYDIYFTAARWDDKGNKIANTRITVYHNGIPVHLNRDVPAKTGAGQKETPEPRPIHFQNHGNPIHYRNMWIVLNDGSPTSCPIACQPTIASPTCPASVVATCSCTTSCGHRRLFANRRCR